MLRDEENVECCDHFRNCFWVIDMVALDTREEL